MSTALIDDQFHDSVSTEEEKNILCDIHLSLASLIPVSNLEARTVEANNGIVFFFFLYKKR